MAAKRTKAKKITLSEFKTWLAGVQSMQPKDWHPSKENWDMILGQIANITETVVEKQVIVQPDKSVPAPVVHYDNPTLDPNNPANAQVPRAQHRPQPVPQQTQLPPSAIPMNTGRPPATVKMGKPTGDHGGVQIEIKDGDGDYESSFS